jgi:hypothetical protein
MCQKGDVNEEKIKPHTQANRNLFAAGWDSLCFFFQSESRSASSIDTSANYLGKFILSL